MLYMRSSDLIQLIRKLVPFDQHPLIFPTPQPLVTTTLFSVLMNYMRGMILLFIDNINEKAPSENEYHQLCLLPFFGAYNSIYFFYID